MLNRSITALDFKADAFVFLKLSRIHTVGELTSHSREDLEENSTRSSAAVLDHVEQVLAENGLSLKQS